MEGSKMERCELMMGEHDGGTKQISLAMSAVK